MRIRTGVLSAEMSEEGVVVSHADYDADVVVCHESDPHECVDDKHGEHI